MDLLVIIVLGAVILYQGIVNYLEKERHDKKEAEMLNRIMSKDYTDYTTNEVYKLNASREAKSPEVTLDDLLRAETQENFPVGN